MDSNLDEYFVGEKSSVDKLLDFLVFLAVLAVTIFLIVEILIEAGKITSMTMDSIGQTYFYVNIVVFIIFLADLVRLRRESENNTVFFKNNWLDILATIPFGLIASGLGPTFEILKLAKISKLTAITKVQKVSRISKISKEFKAAAHLKKESEDYKNKHRL